ncbi:unnamed protein product, partial [Didymodactylos carnosus]
MSKNEKYIGRTKEKKQKGQFSNCYSTCDVLRSNSSPIIDHIDVDKLLLLWSVLTLKHDLALLFWSRTKNKICAALTANLLYTKIIQNKKFQFDKALYQEKAKEFEELAISLLDSLYKFNRRDCIYSIVRQIPSYGNCTWLTIAAEADAEYFIAHRAVQDVLKNIWYGYIDDERTSDITVIVTSFLPFLSGFLRYRNSLIYVDSNKMVNEEFFDCTQYMPYQQQELQHMLSTTESLTKHRDTFIDLDVDNMITKGFYPLYSFGHRTCPPANTKKENESEIFNGTIIHKFYAKHNKLPYLELLLLIWVFTLLCEEIRQ